MKLEKKIIKSVIFTDKNKEGTPFLNKKWEAFKMLHIETKDWRMSKYYWSDNEKYNYDVNFNWIIEEWKEYYIDYTVNWQYKNLNKVIDWDSAELFIEWQPWAMELYYNNKIIEDTDEAYHRAYQAWLEEDIWRGNDVEWYYYLGNNLL